MRTKAKEMQRRISLLKNSLPCAYGFTAKELVAAVLSLDNVPGAFPGLVRSLGQCVCKGGGLSCCRGCIAPQGGACPARQQVCMLHYGIPWQLSTGQRQLTTVSDLVSDLLRRANGVGGCHGSRRDH